jgi:hypothetical protein
VFFACIAFELVLVGILALVVQAGFIVNGGCSVLKRTSAGASFLSIRFLQITIQQRLIRDRRP